jgi:four helix bundle suffix protein
VEINGNNAKDAKDASGGKHHSHNFREFVETRPPEIVANIAICLIHQTNYLVDQQLNRLEQDFLKDGGLRERMTHARLEYRNGKEAWYGEQPPQARTGGQR